MNYVVNLTGNRTSKDGSIIGKVYDFRNEMFQHEQSELNVYKKIRNLQPATERFTFTTDILEKK